MLNMLKSAPVQQTVWRRNDELHQRRFLSLLARAALLDVRVGSQATHSKDKAYDVKCMKNIKDWCCLSHRSSYIW